VDPRDPNRKLTVVVGAVQRPRTQEAAVLGAISGGQACLARRDIPYGFQRLVPDLCGELLLKAAGRSERDDEPQAGVVDLRERLGVPARRVAHQQPGRAGQLLEPLEALADKRKL
jgi:hypothetical protein